MNTHRGLLGWLLILTVPVFGLGTSAEFPTQPEKEKEFTNSIGMVLVRIEPGKFTMGAPKTELKREDGEDEHVVEISQPFWIGKHEVTQAEYKAIMDKIPSRFIGDRLPVETVNWLEAKEFCTKLSKKEGKEYTLPTEAEWEFACRATTRTAFSFGPTISSAQVNYNGNRVYGDGKKGVFRKRTTPVGSLPPNRWGLCDMHGNVWEWCEDWYVENYYKDSPKKDPRGPDKGEARVVRGGSWENSPEDCRSANRGGEPPDSRQSIIGFRVVLRIPARQAPG